MKYLIIMLFVLTGCASSQRKAYVDGCMDARIELMNHFDWKFAPNTLHDYCDLRAGKYMKNNGVHKDMDAIR